MLALESSTGTMNRVAELCATLKPGSPAQWVQGFFLALAGGVLATQFLPRDIRNTLVQYGPRREGGQGSILDKLVGYTQVPHNWFRHFYITSLTCSLFWGWQYMSRGPAMRQLVYAQHRSGEPSPEFGQVLLAWFLLVVQASRRLYECDHVFTPGTKPMWIVHWGLGLIYYAGVSVALWVEGAREFEI